MTCLSKCSTAAMKSIHDHSTSYKGKHWGLLIVSEFWFKVVKAMSLVALKQTWYWISH